jgi:hypothetical protein
MFNFQWFDSSEKGDCNILANFLSLFGFWRGLLAL